MATTKMTFRELYDRELRRPTPAADFVERVAEALFSSLFWTFDKKMPYSYARG